MAKKSKFTEDGPGIPLGVILKKLHDACYDICLVNNEVVAFAYASHHTTDCILLYNGDNCKYTCSMPMGYVIENAVDVIREYIIKNIKKDV